MGEVNDKREASPAAPYSWELPDLGCAYVAKCRSADGCCSSYHLPCVIFASCAFHPSTISIWYLQSDELLLPVDDFAPQNPDTAADPWCIFAMMGSDLVDIW